MTALELHHNDVIMYVRQLESAVTVLSNRLQAVEALLMQAGIGPPGEPRQARPLPPATLSARISSNVAQPA